MTITDHDRSDASAKTPEVNSVDRQVKTEPTQPPGVGTGKRRSLWKLMLIAVCVLLGLVIVMNALTYLPLASVIAAEHYVSRVKGVGIVAQALAIAAVTLRWNTLVDWAISRGWALAQERGLLISMRTKVSIFLWAYLLLVPIGPAAIYRLANG